MIKGTCIAPKRCCFNSLLISTDQTVFLPGLGWGLYPKSVSQGVCCFSGFFGKSPLGVWWWKRWILSCDQKHKSVTSQGEFSCGNDSLRYIRASWSRGTRGLYRLHSKYPAFGNVLSKYRQLTPCGHLTITGTPIIRTAAKSLTKTKYRCLTKINSRYYGLSLVRTLTRGPYSVRY